MPELPEVETVVRGLRPHLVGHRIEGLWYDWAKSLARPEPSIFEARVVGQLVRGITRRAKYICIQLDDAILMVHLKMTGRLYIADRDVQHDADRWVHVKFALDGGKELRFSDSRKFGRVYLTDDIETVTGQLGPEPLEDAFTLGVFRERLQGRQKVIKALLLDQSFVAGVGNIYADEALHRAGVHPTRRSDTLDDAEIERLHQTVVEVLAMGVAHEGASVNWYRKPDGTKGASQEHFVVYGREDLPCVTCGTAIAKVRVAQRGTHYCPRCQA